MDRANCKRAAEITWGVRVMALVPITVLGFRCERCAHEWVPRGGTEEEPRVCPKCRSPWWNRPPKAKAMTYEEFRDKVAVALAGGEQHTWTEVRTTAGLSQLFPNNQWVRRMEADIGLNRRRTADGIIHWQIMKRETSDGESTASPQIAGKLAPRTRRKQGPME
jgi:hypothetical protein